jgi:type I restriction enzyme S subunit
LRGGAYSASNRQNRIVAKIEKLFSNLDNSDKYLLHLEKQLKRYRQSVLKSAFEGKLTKEWRENQTNLETAESLSESVKKYKEKEYSEQLEIWIKVLEDWEKNGKQGNKPRKPSKEKPIKLDEYIETDLPLNWKWEKLGNHAFVTKLAGFEFTKYVTYKELGDIPVIRGQNILKDRFISRNFIYVDREIMEKLPRSRIFGGELLMVFVGAGLGNVGIAPSDKEYFLGPNVAKIALNKFYNNLFIKYYLSSSLGFKNINSHSKATAQDSISMENIRNINVPFLTLEEQKEIVNQIEKHFSIIDKLEAVVQQSIKESKRLRQSILKQAFEGKLVEQDPNDESASILLEKIAKTKEEYQKAQKKQARKK